MRCRLRAKRAKDEQDSEPGHRLREFFDGRPADRVKHDPGALVGRDRQDLLDQVLLVGGNHVAAPASTRACCLDRLRVRATGVAPTLFAIWMAARPTLLDAAGVTVVSPDFSPAMSMSAP